MFRTWMETIREDKPKYVFEILYKYNRVDLDQKDQNGDDLITIARNSGNVDIVHHLLLVEKDRELSELRNVKERHVNFLLNSMEEKKSELECLPGDCGGRDLQLC